MTVHLIVVVPSGYGSVKGTGVQPGSISVSVQFGSSLRIPTTVTPLDGFVVGVPTETVAEVALGAAVTVWFGGQEIVGGGVSTTVTVKVQVSRESEVDVIM